MKRPKFCVGEEVRVRSIYAPEHNTDRTEVIAAKWAAGVVTGFYGWFYKTAHQPDMNKWWIEPSLEKIPPEERLDWAECEWQPSVEHA